MQFLDDVINLFEVKIFVFLKILPIFSYSLLEGF